jgi:hypothetical protein
VDASIDGFPHTLAPLPLVFPDDPNVYGREDNITRGYQWMIGPSLMATPLYGDDYATASTRDIYLPRARGSTTTPAKPTGPTVPARLRARRSIRPRCSSAARAS